MTQLHAQPYDLAATGFYFETLEEYQTKAKALRNDYGDPVEEFEIQFIDGDDIDCDLAKAIGLHQGLIGVYLDAVDTWDDEDKRIVIIAVGECGYDFQPETVAGDFDIELYEFDTMRELAVHFVEEGLFGEIPERFQNYIDYDAIGHELSMDYGEATVAGTHLIYRCA